ncbi:hypothetical protein C5167_032932 [Papaver somniferum]|uniref:CCT-theta n=1 Tax=Papaver somniferum TaxID=3469 RepID=A0A4Y7K8V6_PAPSO|nr:hypothetical protein C5167_032932 [Papaver somniferum]
MELLLRLELSLLSITLFLVLKMMVTGKPQTRIIVLGGVWKLLSLQIPGNAQIFDLRIYTGWLTVWAIEAVWVHRLKAQTRVHSSTNRVYYLSHSFCQHSQEIFFHFEFFFLKSKEISCCKIKMQQFGINSMLKQGHKHFSGLDEAVMNIDGCKQLSTITRTSFGPNGMNKMVIDHTDKLFVTNDAATIVNELEVQHPAAKLLEEIGDGANLTISFAGELLQKAEELIRIGLHPSEIISGYMKGTNKIVEILESLVEKGSETMDVRNTEEVASRMKAVVASKQFDQENILCPLIADACIQVCPKNPTNFNVDNVRVAKLQGGGLRNSMVIRGMVLKGDASGSIKMVEKAKIVVFVGGVDTSATETKGTVLIHSAEQLENYGNTEEAKIEELIKSVADLGAKVIVSGAAVGEMALHFCERYKLMVLRISSKFELRRFFRTTGSIALLNLRQPSPDDLGHADSISVGEIGGARVTVVKNEEGGNSVATVVLRGSTDSILDDLERAVDDGVNTCKAMCRDSLIVPGAAATEIELARQLKEFSFKEVGLDQYAINKFAESFEMVPRSLAENAGLNSMEIISSLYAEHVAGNSKILCPQIRFRSRVHCTWSGSDYNGQTSRWTKERSSARWGRNG